MNTENDSKVQIEEQTYFFENGLPLSVVKKADDELKTSNLQNNGIKDDALSKSNVNLVRILGFSIFFICLIINDIKTLNCISTEVL